jgi:signal transduction histidine kinase
VTRRLARSWFLVAVLAWVGPRAAAAAVTLDGGADQHDLIPHLDGLDDPAGTLTIDEVAVRELRPLGELDAGLGRWPGDPPYRVWLHFTVEVPAGPPPARWYLLLGRPQNPGTVYVQQPAGGYRATPVRLDPRGGSFRAELPSTPGTWRVFFHVTGPLVKPSLLHVATPSGEELLLQRHLIAQGIYLGVMLAMLLMNLFVGALLRDRAQLWYVGFIAASITAFSLLTGTVGRYVLQTMTATEQFRFQTVALALTVLAGIQFSRLFLDTRRRSPGMDRVMRGFLAVTALVAASACVVPDLLASRLVAMLGVLVPIVALSAGVSALRAGSPWARFYLAGWTLFSVGGFLFAAPIQVPGLDALAAFQTASALEAASFTVALADRLRILRGERALAEQALARSEQRLQSIFDNTIDATWLLDGEARVVEINDTARSRWRATAERSRGALLRALPPWSGDDRAAALLARALARVGAGQEARFETMFGEQPGARWYDVSVKTIEPGLTLVEARDITDLRQAELQMARAEKLAALGQLVAGVAHEINNPNNFLTFNLPIVLDYLEAVRPHVEAADRERGGDIRLFGLTVEEFFADATTLVGNMKRGAERITAIVSQLKSYVRQRDEAAWEMTDPNRVVEAAATLVRTQLRQWVAHLDLQLGEDLPRVGMNPGRMEQVIINLLVNAGQAAAAKPDGRVGVRTRRQDGFVEIAVEDNGPGVPDANRERIFEPFFTTKSGDQGTGMGLAISQRIVEEHGGSLELAQNGAAGACFIVRLPITTEQS